MNSFGHVNRSLRKVSIRLTLSEVLVHDLVSQDLCNLPLSGEARGGESCADFVLIHDIPSLTTNPPGMSILKDFYPLA